MLFVKKFVTVFRSKTRAKFAFSIAFYQGLKPLATYMSYLRHSTLSLKYITRFLKGRKQKHHESLKDFITLKKRSDLKKMLFVKKIVTVFGSKIRAKFAFFYCFLPEVKTPGYLYFVPTAL